jgi:SAM-dependent methyltransferase
VEEGLFMLPPADAVAAQRRYWDDVYARPALNRSTSPAHVWLESLLHQADVKLHGLVLEIGCGRGLETAQLAKPHRTIISLDLSLVALKQAAANVPSAQFLQAALPNPLPFRTAVFDGVLAGLSLHYFPRDETRSIIAGIRRILKPGKPLVFRVNAAGDTLSGYREGEEVEPGVFLREGRYKRFFTEQDCINLFDEDWRLAVLQQGVEHRYGFVKQTWAGIAMAT